MNKEWNGQSLIKLRRELHRSAEVGFSLDGTRSIIQNALCALDVEYKEIGKGSIVARLGAGECGILLRADMDALAMREESAVDFASQNGCMHACGHDMHTAMLLGALANLSKNRTSLPVEIRFLFQASEENLMGARDAIEHGVLSPWEEICTKNSRKCKQLLEKEENFFIKSALSLHCIVGIAIPLGTLIVPREGVSAPASAFFTVKLTGESAHGGAPQMGRDALFAMHSLYSAFCSLTSRTVSIKDEPLLTVGQMQAGVSANVIAARAQMSGTVRASDDGAEECLLSRMRHLTAQISAAFGVSGELSINGFAPTLRNDPSLAQRAYRCLCEALPHTRVVFSEELYGTDGQKKSGGSEDFAHFSHLIPSLLVAIGAGDLREGYTAPLHHPAVRFDERALEIGAEAYASLALCLADIVPSP